MKLSDQLRVAGCGLLLGIWCTPHMTITHLVFAILLSLYVLIGIYYEEKDLVRTFGHDYKDYQDLVPKLIPLPKHQRKTSEKTPERSIIQ